MIQYLELLSLNGTVCREIITPDMFLMLRFWYSSKGQNIF